MRTLFQKIKFPNIRFVGKTTGTILSTDGVQEVAVIIRGRYIPNTIEVARGVPVRIKFFRDEDDACSGRVIFSGFGIDRKLRAFTETSIEFLPESAGEYLFTCEMGMYRGRLLVS